MAKYSATQQWTKLTEHTAGGWTMEAGAVIYRTCATLRELAQEIEKVQGMKACRQYVFDPLITVCVGVRARDGRLPRSCSRARRLRAARRAAAPSAGRSL